MPALLTEAHALQYDALATSDAFSQYTVSETAPLPSSTLHTSGVAPHLLSFLLQHLQSHLVALEDAGISAARLIADPSNMAYFGGPRSWVKSLVHQPF